MTELSNGQSSPGLQRVKDSPICRSLPRHFKLAANTPASAISYYKISKDKLYVAKSISLVCQVAYAHVAEIFLTNLYKWVSENGVIKSTKLSTLTQFLGHSISLHAKRADVFRASLVQA